MTYSSFENIFNIQKMYGIFKPHVEKIYLNTPLFQYILETWKEQQLF